jgi:hypothetical protein
MDSATRLERLKLARVEGFEFDIERRRATLTDVTLEFQFQWVGNANWQDWWRRCGDSLAKLRQLRTLRLRLEVTLGFTQDVLAPTEVDWSLSPKLQCLETRLLTLPPSMRDSAHLLWPRCIVAPGLRDWRGCRLSYASVTTTVVYSPALESLVVDGLVWPGFSADHERRQQERLARQPIRDPFTSAWLPPIPPPTFTSATGTASADTDPTRIDWAAALAEQLGECANLSRVILRGECGDDTGASEHDIYGRDRRWYWTAADLRSLAQCAPKLATLVVPVDTRYDRVTWRDVVEICRRAPDLERLALVDRRPAGYTDRLEGRSDQRSSPTGGGDGIGGDGDGEGGDDEGGGEGDGEKTDVAISAKRMSTLEIPDWDASLDTRLRLPALRRLTVSGIVARRIPPPKTSTATATTTATTSGSSDKVVDSQPSSPSPSSSPSPVVGPRTLAVYAEHVADAMSRPEWFVAIDRLTVVLGPQCLLKLLAYRLCRGATVIVSRRAASPVGLLRSLAAAADARRAASLAADATRRSDSLATAASHTADSLATVDPASDQRFVSGFRPRTIALTGPGADRLALDDARPHLAAILRAFPDAILEVSPTAFQNLNIAASRVFAGLFGSPPPPPPPPLLSALGKGGATAFAGASGSVGDRSVGVGVSDSDLLFQRLRCRGAR